MKYYGTDLPFWEPETNVFKTEKTKDKAFSSKEFAVLFGERTSIDGASCPNGARAVFYHQKGNTKVRHPKRMIERLIELCAADDYTQAVMSLVDYYGSPKLEVWFDRADDVFKRQALIDGLGGILGVKSMKYIRHDDVKKEKHIHHVSRSGDHRAVRDQQRSHKQQKQIDRPTQPNTSKSSKGKTIGRQIQHPEVQPGTIANFQQQSTRRVDHENKKKASFERFLELRFKLGVCRDVVQKKTDLVKDVLDTNTALVHRSRSNTTGTASAILRDAEKLSHPPDVLAPTYGPWWFPDPPSRKPAPISINESECKTYVGRFMEDDTNEISSLDIESSIEFTKSEIEVKERENESLTEFIKDKVKPQTRPRNYTTGTAPDSKAELEQLVIAEMDSIDP